MDKNAKDGEGGLLKFRYKHTMMTVECRYGATARVVPTCGGLQGDSVMAHMFRETFSSRVIERLQIGYHI